MGIFGGRPIDKGLSIIDKAVVDKDKRQELASSLVEKELDNGDLFTRRARPMLIYFGLFVILSELFGLRFWDAHVDASSGGGH